MKRKLLAVIFGCLVLAVCGITLAQNSIGPVPPPSVPQVYIPGQDSAPAQIPSNNLPVLHMSTVKTESKPDDLTIDQILDTVENIREQKAELEKKEKLYLKALRRKSEKLKERIDRVEGDSVTPPVYVPAVSPSQYIPPTSVPVTR